MGDFDYHDTGGSLLPSAFNLAILTGYNTEYIDCITLSKHSPGAKSLPHCSHSTQPSVSSKSTPLFKCHRAVISLRKLFYLFFALFPTFHPLCPYECISQNTNICLFIDLLYTRFEKMSTLISYISQKKA